MYDKISDNNSAYVVVDERNTAWPCATAIDAQAKMEELRQIGVKSVCVSVIGRSD